MNILEKRENLLPTVMIVGRPNIGKSSLFNAIMRKRISIVHEQAGVTRDRVSMPTHWKNHHFLLVDTGGLGIMRDEKKGEFFDLEIRRQLEAVLETVDVIIQLTNVQEGITPMDREVMNFIREKGKKYLVACNKVDNPDLIDNAQEFYNLGVEDITPISCLHRFQIDLLLDKLIKLLPEVDKQQKNDLFLSVIGRPNVGKSSIINTLLDEERVIVSSIAGTTRDAVDIPFSYKSDESSINGVLVDTAGIKRKGKVDNVVDVFSMMRSEDAIKRSSVVLFVIDASSGVTSYDKKIASSILKYGRPCLIIVNKWDLKQGTVKKQIFEEQIFGDIPFLRYAPLIFVSALKKIGLENIFEKIILINSQSKIKVPTALVNQVLQDITQRTPPASSGNAFFKIYYGLMEKNPPAKFIIFCNRKSYLQKTYLSFIEKQLRRAFSLTGIPIEINLKERKHVQENYREGSAIPKNIKEKMAYQRRQEKIKVRRKKR